MCGIVGFSTNTNSLIDNRAFLKAIEKLNHRGPDASGKWLSSDNKVGLGHTRLSIIDLSESGAQPMIYNDQYIISYNGEIYNFRELRDELVKKGYVFNGTSDTEVVLKLFVEYGLSCFEKLNGIFSISLYDNSSDTLILVRDAMGVKPLYYACDNGKFIFSSEIKSLIHLVDLPFVVDVNATVNYLSFLYNPDVSTPNAYIKKFAPGDVFVIRDGGIIEKKSISNWGSALPGNHHLSKEKLVDGLRGNLQRAVERQMISDVEVGAFLSGGLDSSAIAYFASKVNPDLKCFTISSGDASDPGIVADLPYAKEVAAHLKVDLRVVEVNSKDISGSLESMIYQLDEPLADPAALNVYLISKFAKQAGIKVLLSGAGGDDIFTGYRRHQAVVSEKLWEWVPLYLRKEMAKLVNLNSTFGRFRRVRKLLQNAALEPESRLINYFRWTENSTILRLLKPELRQTVKDELINSPMKIHLDKYAGNLNRIEKMLELEKRFFLADHNLLYTDKMSMAAGVEVRVPFLDRDLMDFANSIPTEYKQRGLQSKWILKKAMEPYLPRKTIYRPKTGFGLPIRSWIKNELNEMMNDLLSEEAVSRRGLFDYNGIVNLINYNNQNKIDGSYTILSLMCLELWFRRFSVNG